jgi:ferredoxin
VSHHQHTVILVYSTSHALRAERVLGGAGVGCKLIPVPRQLSSDCGVCLRICPSDVETASRALHVAHVEIAGVHTIESD